MVNLVSAVAPRADADAVRGVGIILVASFLFGTMAVCVRLAASEMAVTQVAFVRFAGSFLVLLAVTRGRHLRPHPGALGALLLRGLLGTGAISLYYFAIKTAGAGFATLLHCTYPVPTAVIAVLWLGESFDRRLAVGLVLSAAGVFIVLAPAVGMEPQTMLGGLSALAASVLAGGAVSTARYLRATESASLITTYFMAVGATVTAPALLSGLPQISLFLAIALAGVVLASAAGQWLLHEGLGFASATQGSLAAATTVVTAAGLEALFLGSSLSSSTLLGASLMVVAVGLAVNRRSVKDSSTAPATGLGARGSDA